MTERRVLYETRVRGLPALWEEGGQFDDEGDAIIITSPDGSPMVPFYIRKKGNLVYLKHALFVVDEGTVVIEAEHTKGDFEIRIWRIERLLWEDEAWQADFYLLARYYQGEWDNEWIFPDFEKAVNVAKEKAMCLFCKEPHYFKEGENYANGM